MVWVQSRQKSIMFSHTSLRSFVRRLNNIFIQFLASVQISLRQSLASLNCQIKDGNCHSTNCHHLEVNKWVICPQICVHIAKREKLIPTQPHARQNVADGWKSWFTVYNGWSWVVSPSLTGSMPTKGRLLWNYLHVCLTMPWFLFHTEQILFYLLLRGILWLLNRKVEGEYRLV